MIVAPASYPPCTLSSGKYGYGQSHRRSEPYIVLGGDRAFSAGLHFWLDPRHRDSGVSFLKV